MLNLTKNSSLAVAMDFPILSLSQHDHQSDREAIEGFSLIMVVYLCFSLLTFAFHELVQ